MKYVFNPHIFYSPHIREGLVSLSFDLRVGPGAKVWHEWRDRSHPYRVGPSLSIDAKGVLSANLGRGKGKRVLMTVPHDTWIHFEIRAGLGKQATGTWRLTVTVRGRKPKHFTDLPHDPKCRRLEWLGFVSNATQRTVFYLDNVKLERIKP